MSNNTLDGKAGRGRRVGGEEGISDLEEAV